MDHKSLSSLSSSLILRVKARDSDAWVRLTQLYGPLVYRWARQTGLQASDAADIVQEVFRAVSANIDGFSNRDGAGSFRGWLWTIARNKIRDLFRRRAKQPQAVGGTDANQQFDQMPDLSDEEPESADFDSATSLTHRAMSLIREEFATTSWQAFWRSTVDGQPAAEIAEDLGMTTGAVRQAKYRVLRRLREELADD